MTHLKGLSSRSCLVDFLHGFLRYRCAIVAIVKSFPNSKVPSFNCFSNSSYWIFYDVHVIISTPIVDPITSVRGGRGATQLYWRDLVSLFDGGQFCYTSCYHTSPVSGYSVFERPRHAVIIGASTITIRTSANRTTTPLSNEQDTNSKFGTMFPMTGKEKF